MRLKPIHQAHECLYLVGIHKLVQAHQKKLYYHVASTAKPQDRLVAVATVSGTDFANKGAKFSISPTTNVTIDENTGFIAFGANASGDYTVTATSVFDPKKTGTAAITVS